jgi:hypothetical protein
MGQEEVSRVTAGEETPEPPYPPTTNNFIFNYDNLGVRGFAS